MFNGGYLLQHPLTPSYVYTLLIFWYLLIFSSMSFDDWNMNLMKCFLDTFQIYTYWLLILTIVNHQNVDAYFVNANLLWMSHAYMNTKLNEAPCLKERKVPEVLCINFQPLTEVSCNVSVNGNKQMICDELN